MPEDVTLIPEGKLRCIVTGVLRNDTPEEHVRQRIARSLLKDYGYYRDHIEIEFTVNLGRAKKLVDIAIFSADTAHKQENIKINPDIENIKKSLEKLKKHLIKSKSDQPSRRALIKREAKLRKLESLK